MVGWHRDCSREYAARERAIGDDGDAQVPTGLQERFRTAVVAAAVSSVKGVLDLGAEGAVFHLDAGDLGMDGVGAAEGRGGDFAQTDVVDFTLPARAIPHFQTGIMLVVFLKFIHAK